MLEHIGQPPRGLKLIKLDDLSFAGFSPLRLPPIGRPDDRLAAILYTSGTSGRPKGVMLTHRNLRSNVEASIQHAGLRRADGFLGVLPQFHSFGLTALTLIPLFMAAQVVYTARFVPAKLVKLIARHRPEIMMALPSMYNALLGVKKAGPEDFESIRLAVSGAEPLSRQVHDAFVDRFGVNILEGYGLTETSPVIAWSLPDRHERGAVGPVLPNLDLRTVDPEGNPTPTGTEGQIIVRGPSVMAGYYRMPDKTAEVMDDDGFFHTGDMGRIDTRGLLHITGRIKEMLIIGGENVFPGEIERVLSEHPSVAAAGVVGRADPSRGEVAVAFVEIIEGQSFDEAALRRHCREHLAGFKVPRQITPVDQLPRSPTGKVLRRELASQVPDAPPDRPEET
jgi:long-chain acyl-CoA synthetase